jgi:hypothetical protein
MTSNTMTERAVPVHGKDIFVAESSAALSGQSATIEGRRSLVQRGSPALTLHIRVRLNMREDFPLGTVSGFLISPDSSWAASPHPRRLSDKGPGDSVASKEQNHDRERYRCDFR